MSDKLDEIRARHAAATPGPYIWHGWGGRERKAIQIELCTTHSGMQIVMDFKRSGFDGAVPRFCTGDVSQRNDFAVGGIMKPVHAFAHYPKDYKDEIRGIDHADATAIEKSWEDVHFLIAEVERLQGVIERDRTIVAHLRENLLEEMSRWTALTEGRGPYEWDDDEYRREFKRCLEALRVIMKADEVDALIRDHSDCPTDSSKIAEARTSPPTIEQLLRTVELTPEEGDAIIERVRARVRKPSEAPAA